MRGEGVNVLLRAYRVLCSILPGVVSTGLRYMHFVLLLKSTRVHVGVVLLHSLSLACAPLAAAIDVMWCRGSQC